MLNTLYSITPEKGQCTVKMIPEALQNILDSNNYTFQEILFRLPERQKQLLIAINKEGEARAVTSGGFVQKKQSPVAGARYRPPSKDCFEKDFITHEQGVYRIYDRFFGIWLEENY